MSLWQLMKLHYVYLFSKKNIIAIIICLVIALGFNLYSWLENDSLALPSIQVIELSWQTIFTFDKLIIHTIAIFIMGNFCLLENDQYYCLFIFRKVTKNRFFIVKMLVLTLMVIATILILFLLFVMSGYLLNHHFILKIMYVKGFLYCLLSALTFGFFTIILVKIFPTVMSIIIGLIAFLASDLFEENVLMSTIFPVVTIDSLKNTSAISFVLSIIVLFFYLFIAIIANFTKK